MQLQTSLKEIGAVRSNTEAKERVAKGFIIYIILQCMSKVTVSAVSSPWKVYRLE